MDSGPTTKTLISSYNAGGYFLLSTFALQKLVLLLHFILFVMVRLCSLISLRQKLTILMGGFVVCEERALGCTLLMQAFCPLCSTSATTEHIFSWLCQHREDGPRVIRRLYKKTLFQFHVIGDAHDLHMQSQHVLAAGGVHFADQSSVTRTLVACTRHWEWCPKSFDTMQKLRVHLWMVHQNILDERRLLRHLFGLLEMFLVNGASPTTSTSLTILAWRLLQATHGGMPPIYLLCS